MHDNFLNLPKNSLGKKRKIFDKNVNQEKINIKRFFSNVVIIFKQFKKKFKIR